MVNIKNGNAAMAYIKAIEQACTKNKTLFDALEKLLLRNMEIQKSDFGALTPWKLVR